jgi:acyl-CoA synthetase (NDP forming)
MLEARSVALVGASPRPGSLGARMIAEVGRSPSRPRAYLVNPRHESIGDDRCHPALEALPEAVDLALFAVPDAALPDAVAAGVAAGARSGLVFGSAVGVRDRIAAVTGSRMPLCGAGCMGFVNVARGLRAVGYLEADPLPAGPVALVTHSGSVFSALLRTRRAFGFTVAVSSGQELVTTAAEYARYALTLPETKVLALVLETVRSGPLLRSVLAEAAAGDVPVVLLPAGFSGGGRSLVSAHSGALAAGPGAWEALAAAYGAHLVGDLAEMADTLELFCAGRRAPASGGLATVHDSGFERAHVADIATELGVPFADVSPATRARLAAVLDPGLEPGNPLDLWGTGRDTEALFTEALAAFADDPAVGAVALAVDLVHEYDGDQSYPDAVLAAAAGTTKPVAVLASVPAAIDADVAARLRASGVPVLDSARGGLRALRHLLGHGAGPVTGGGQPPPANRERQARWLTALTAGPLSGAGQFALLRDYGIPTVAAETACSLADAVAAADRIGYPVAVKADAPGIAHKSDVNGVLLNLPSPARVADAYADLAERLGPRVVVCAMAPPGVELILGIARDPSLGPLLVLGAGGVLAELLAERSVALPPVSVPAARAMLRRLRAWDVLSGARGRPSSDVGAVAAAVSALSVLATELGEALDALDINPLACGPSGVVALDVLAVARLRSGVRRDVDVPLPADLDDRRERVLAGSGLLGRVPLLGEGLAVLEERRRVGVREARVGRRAELPGHPDEGLVPVDGRVAERGDREGGKVAGGPAAPLALSLEGRGVVVAGRLRVLGVERGDLTGYGRGRRVVARGR